MTTGFVNGAVSVDDAATSRTNLGTPSTTGTGASGTWSINISGNAATATSSGSATTTNPLTISTGLSLNSGTTFDGSVARTLSIDASVVTLTGAQVLTNKTFTAPILGTPISGDLSNCTAYSANNLSGTTLNSSVVTSSLTSVGTLVGITIANAGYIRTATSTSGSVLFRAGSIAGGGYVTMATLSGGAAASLAFTQPATSTLTWDGGAIGSVTPAAGTFTALAANTSINASFLTASNVVATDGSKNFASLAYASANTVSTLVIRDGSGNFSAGTITATLSGNASTATSATTATTATNATNIAITDTTTNSTMYPLLSSATTGNTAARTTSTIWTVNPSNGVMTLGTATASSVTSRLTLSNTASGTASLALTGSGTLTGSSTDGVAITLGTNGIGNRQLWIGDTALLTANNTNTVVRISGQNSNFSFIDAVTTDGSTAKTLNFQQGGGATTFGSGLFTASGTMSKPAQPCFLVHQTSDLTGLTKGADNTITWNQEVFDQSNNFSSNTFTAPVTGRYLFNINGITPQSFNSATRFFAKFVTSNRTYTICNYNPTAVNPSDNLPSFGSSIIADMDAADTATIVTFCSGGTSTYDINGDQESPYWSGCLLA